MHASFFSAISHGFAASFADRLQLRGMGSIVTSGIALERPGIVSTPPIFPLWLQFRRYQTGPFFFPAKNSEVRSRADAGYFSAHVRWVESAVAGGIGRVFKIRNLTGLSRSVLRAPEKPVLSSLRHERSLAVSNSDQASHVSLTRSSPPSLSLPVSLTANRSCDEAGGTHERTVRLAGGRARGGARDGGGRVLPACVFRGGPEQRSGAAAHRALGRQRDRHPRHRCRHVHPVRLPRDPVLRHGAEEEGCHRGAGDERQEVKEATFFTRYIHTTVGSSRKTSARGLAS